MWPAQSLPSRASAASAGDVVALERERDAAQGLADLLVADGADVGLVGGGDVHGDRDRAAAGFSE